MIDRPTFGYVAANVQIVKPVSTSAPLLPLGYIRLTSLSLRRERAITGSPGDTNWTEP